MALPTNPKLAVSRTEAETLLRDLLANAEGLLSKRIPNFDDLDDLKRGITNYNSNVSVIINRIFSNPPNAHDYTVGAGVINIGGRRRSLLDETGDRHRALKNSISRIENLVEQLALFDEASQSGSEPTRRHSSSALDTSKVFIVHGHDDALRSEVARLITQLGFTPIILHEQPNQGKTIIEKLETHTETGFAIILVTGDDIGAVKSSLPQIKNGDISSIKLRARQNVMLELGLMFGLIGRDRTCILYEPDVEIPSDISGMTWNPIDKNGYWKILVAKELNAAGYSVDLNRLLK